MTLLQSIVVIMNKQMKVFNISFKSGKEGLVIKEVYLILCIGNTVYRNLV